MKKRPIHINNVVIVSGEQQRDSAIHIHVSISPQAPLPSRLPHNVEQSSLCSTVGHVIQYQECLIIHHPFVQSVSIYGTCTCASCCPGPWRQSSLGLCPNMDHILVEKLERKWKGTGRSKGGTGTFERKQIHEIRIQKDKNYGGGGAGQKKHKIVGKEINN